MSWRGDVTSSSEVAQAAAVASGSKMSDAGDKMLASSGDQQDSPEDKLNRAYGAAAGAVVAVVAGVLSGKAQKTANKALELPKLDSTGKVHGTLPKPQDLKQYNKDELALLRDELKQSVQQRIDKNVQMGSDPGHGERQAAEQQLIKTIDRYLDDK